MNFSLHFIQLQAICSDGKPRDTVSSRDSIFTVLVLVLSLTVLVLVLVLNLTVLVLVLVSDVTVLVSCLVETSRQL